MKFIVESTVFVVAILSTVFMVTVPFFGVCAFKRVWRDFKVSY